MYLFIDGQPVILTFEQVEQLYYQAFVNEFGSISMAQWRGSYEYQALYPAIQMMVENGVITQSAINEAMQAVTDLNEAILRPAVLYSRVPERFAEEGYIASIRVATMATAGVVAICVDYPAPPLTRTMTVGNDGALQHGYELGLFGSIDNLIFDTGTIERLTFPSDYATDNYILFSGGLVLPNYPTTLSLNFAGFGVVVFTLDVDRYKLIDNALTDFIVANDGLDISFVIENEITTDPEVDRFIADLIGYEMLPSGQWMEGTITLPYVIANGQVLDITWTVPTLTDIKFRITLTRDRNSFYPVDDVTTIVNKFLANFDELHALGQDIKPETYYTQDDAPWSSSILTEYSLDGGSTWATSVIQVNYNDKYIAELAPADVVII